MASMKLYVPAAEGSLVYPSDIPTLIQPRTMLYTQLINSTYQEVSILREAWLGGSNNYLTSMCPGTLRMYILN